jgi:hypothetical protein
MWMKIWLLLNICCIGFVASAQRIQIIDSLSQEPLPFATISFKNGKGTFADGDGRFLFSRKRYPDVDSLAISSIGYQELQLSTASITDTLFMKPSTSQLDAVVVMGSLEGEFDTVEIEPVEHDNYFDSWLPTVESEIAVRFEREDNLPTQISKLLLPVLVEEKPSGKKRRVREFSTMIRLAFYGVKENGAPEYNSNYPNTTIVVTHEVDEIFEADVEFLNLQIPASGLFASIQVLGYTYPDGRLIDAKKYREIQTRRGTEKISTTYRPLLPFTDKIEGKKTYVRRVFLNDKAWQVFDLSYNPNSKLIRSGHDNYGMGAILKVYEKG